MGDNDDCQIASFPGYIRGIFSPSIATKSLSSRQGSHFHLLDGENGSELYDAFLRLNKQQIQDQKLSDSYAKGL